MPDQRPDIEPHLERILASPEFAAAEQLRRFLRFSVEATLRGEEAQLKEYLLGREVFGRGDGFDPRLDPIVRVEARRLRTKLKEYYDGAGRGEPLRIELPKGGYAASFRPAAQPDAARRRSVPWRWIGAAVAAAALVGVFVANRPARGEDLLAVVPARWVWSPGETELLSSDEAIAEAITAELANRRIAKVVAWPVIAARRRAGAGGQKISEIAAEVKARRLMVVAVRPSAGGSPRVTAYLLEAASGRKEWAGESYLSGSVQDAAIHLAQEWNAFR